MIERELEYRVEPSYSDRSRWQLVIISGNSGTVIPTDFGTQEKAREVADYLREQLAPEHAEMERLSEIRHQEPMARLDREAEERRRKDDDRRTRLERGEGRQVEKWQCPSCEHRADPDEFEEPMYECSRCDGQQREERRCEQCNIFMAKVADRSCPSCEEPLESEPEVVVGTEIDGVFYAAEEAA